MHKSVEKVYLNNFFIYRTIAFKFVRYKHLLYIYVYVVAESYNTNINLDKHKLRFYLNNGRGS